MARYIGDIFCQTPPRLRYPINVAEHFSKKLSPILDEIYRFHFFILRFWEHNFLIHILIDRSILQYLILNNNIRCIIQLCKNIMQRK